MATKPPTRYGINGYEQLFGIFLGVTINESLKWCPSDSLKTLRPGALVPWPGCFFRRRRMFSMACRETMPIYSEKDMTRLRFASKRMDTKLDSQISQIRKSQNLIEISPRDLLPLQDGVDHYHPFNRTLWRSSLRLQVLGALPFFVPWWKIVAWRAQWENHGKTIGKPQEKPYFSWENPP